ncbi:VOC family protein [Nocardioides sp.]|uniref:VOC family protein n=1 Tax=Nocardioides sp. TaxID=35761 RepID=UPI002723B1B6|nr:VOC family protein [Nocardioides sp.]MDO9457808.1 VOC family protein [Nocardioides sp.]
MALHLVALAFDAHDPSLLARFWSGVLGWELDGDGTAVAPRDGDGLRIRFLPTEEPKTHPNQMHFDLMTTSLDDQQQTVERALARGGHHLDIGQLPEEEHVVLADPEENEFCVVEPTNGFLAGCGRIGALSSDGSQQVGYFWSAALGWPLVWDRDEETAIQSADGGMKISWGGPPWRDKTGRNRLHLDLAPPAEGDQETEVERLVAIGATRVGASPHEDGAVAMLDPDGNELCVLGPR